MFSNSFGDERFQEHNATLVSSVGSRCCWFDNYVGAFFFLMYACRIGGDVTIGHGCVLHPKCSIHAEAGGSIDVGSNNIFEELCEIRFVPMQRCCKGVMPSSTTMPAELLAAKKFA